MIFKTDVNGFNRLKKEQNLPDDITICMYVVDKGSFGNAMSNGSFGFLPSLFAKKEGGLIILADDGLFFVKYTERIKMIWEDSYTFIPFRSIAGASHFSAPVVGSIFKRSYSPAINFRFLDGTKITTVLFGLDDDTDDCLNKIIEAVKKNVRNIL